MRWCYRQLEAEYDYLTSDEAVLERLDEEEWGRLALEDQLENDDA